MNCQYFPHTEEDLRQMLAKAGVDNLDGLFADVPEEFIYKGEFDLPEAKSEDEIRTHFRELSDQIDRRRLVPFVGQGAYDHYCPSVIPYLASRSEFITAYTPYQPEISQGTLRYIFEYQSVICELTGMDCSNASMYDGATAAAESLMMAMASTRKKSRVLVSQSMLPNVLEVVDTYSHYNGYKVDRVPVKDGQTDIEAAIAEVAKGDVAGVLVPGINRYGVIEDLSGLADALHAQKGLLLVYSDPSSLAVIKTPGEWGADIVCGEAQSLGIPLCFGGPYLGFLACKKENVRKLPGRIVGATIDKDGNRCFVLTLQAREQHIRREKATSNICSNQSLMALWVTIYTSLMGPEGLREVNELSCAGARYLYGSLLKTGAFEEVTDKPFLKEFVLKLKDESRKEELQRHLMDKGFLVGLDASEGYMSFCVTERRSKEEADALVAAVESFINN